MHDGRIDPLGPLQEYIDVFQALPEDRVARLPTFIDAFSTLCDMLAYKVQAFKTAVFSANKDRLKQLVDQGQGIDDIVEIIPWQVVPDFTWLSGAIFEDVFTDLGRLRRVLPACIPPECDQEPIPVLALESEATPFSSDKACALEILAKELLAASLDSIPLARSIDVLVGCGFDRVRACMVILHLIQDGDAILLENGAVRGAYQLTTRSATGS
jgi:hypothetical protein